MKKLLTIVGARPQFIKAAALSRRIREHYPGTVKETIVHTGQHYDHNMSQVFFEEMGIPEPAVNLEIGSGSHGLQTGRMMIAMEEVMLQLMPDAVVLYGDTNSTLAGAMVASKHHLPVFHIEAGLRSFNKTMPEEINRIGCDHVSTLLFSPTVQGIENLAAEGFRSGSPEPYHIDNPGIFHTGDVMYDNALFFTSPEMARGEVLDRFGLSPGTYILGTIHRPVNTDQPSRLAAILEALRQVAHEHRQPVVLPLHPRTRHIMEQRDRQFLDQLANDPLIRIQEPVSYLEMLTLEQQSSLILTDSGGVQKEAWFFKKPLLVLRKETEWKEIIDSGNGCLVDADQGAIVKEAARYLAHPPADFPPLYGKGDAAGEILEIILGTRWS